MRGAAFCSRRSPPPRSPENDPARPAHDTALTRAPSSGDQTSARADTGLGWGAGVRCGISVAGKCGDVRTIGRFRVLPRLSGRAWGACFQSGIPALPFDGGQPIPPGYDLRGFVWCGYPSGHRSHSGGRKSLSGKVPAGGLFLARENSKPWAGHQRKVLHHSSNQAI